MKEDVYKLAQMMRAAGAVKRYHAVRTIRTQDIAAHSWGVAALVLCVQPDPSAAILTAALMHDMEELRTGDIPATAKWRSQKLTDALNEMEEQFRAEYSLPSSSNLSDQEKHVLRWCDLAELVYWCLEDFNMGNDYTALIVRRGIDALIDLGPPTDAAKELQARMVDDANEAMEIGSMDDGK